MNVIIYVSDSLELPVKKLERNNSFGSNSSQSSNSSATPFYPKKKRKILNSRSAKNIREMRSASSIIPGNEINRKSKGFNTRLKKSFMSLISPKSREKRKHSSSSDDSCSKVKKTNSTGLTSVLSDFRLNQSLNVSSDIKSASDDSVFFKSPPVKIEISNSEAHEKLINNNSISNTAIQRTLHSSLIEEKSKKNVNFFFDTQNSTGHTDEVSYMSIRGFSDCSSVASHPPFRDNSNLLFCTPNGSRRNHLNIQSVSSYYYFSPSPLSVCKCYQQIFFFLLAMDRHTILEHY